MLLSPVLLPGLIIYAIDSFTFTFAPSSFAFSLAFTALSPLALPFALAPASLVEAWVGDLTTYFACTLLLAVALSFAVLANLCSWSSFALAYGRGTQPVRMS